MNIRKHIKIGTWFKWLIRPMVWSYDFVWGTDLLQCEVCKKREQEMNEDFIGFIRKMLTNKQ